MRPYLSVVAAARNDDHGGNLLRRMQTFVNALVGQAKRHGVSTELVLVEWNPPPDRPRLAQALQWPADRGPCTIRIIEVSPELHRRYKHAEALPLYQMIAKNVGIRRAQGQFILATNIDIVFSDELFQFLSSGRLERGKMYRVDRYDVMADVPVDASVDEQLAYCESHLLRLNAREGTFNVGAENLRLLAAEDIAAQNSGVFLGRGWYQVEQYFGQRFRWVGNDAEVTVKPPSDKAKILTFDLEAGPGVAYKPFLLQVLDEPGALIGESRVEKRSVIRLQLSFRAGERRTFRLRVVSGGLRTAYDPRILNFRVFRCAWQSRVALSRTASDVPAIIEVTPRYAGVWQKVAGLLSGTWQISRRGARFLRQLSRATGPIRVGLPIAPRSLEGLQLRIEGSGISLALGCQRGSAALSTPMPEAAAEALHTNACGDFTLLAREHWLDLRGYPEFDLFSMNLDAVFCHAAHNGGAREEILPHPIRIYHIEHGSGWTPEGHAKLFERIAAKGLFWVENQEVIGWATQMQRLEAPMIFNREDWGLADADLRETVLPATVVRARSPR